LRDHALAMKVIKAILTTFDWVAMAFVFLAVIGLVGLSICGAISIVMKELRASWSQGVDDKIFLTIIVLSVAWCALRRKKLF
jgi:hypothetical protein